MENFEVETPILNTPFDEPAEYWLIEDGKMPERMRGRRPAGYYYRSPNAPETTSMPRAANGASWRWSTCCAGGWRNGAKRAGPASRGRPAS
jgi:hypothetical protein